MESNNGSQTVHKRFTKPDTINRMAEETVHKRGENGSQTVHKRFTKPVITNRIVEETVHNNNIEVSSLPNIQRKVLFALFRNSQINGDRTTQKVNLQFISSISEVKLSSLKNTLWRLRKKGYIKTVEYKDGRGGWSCYKIAKEVHKEILYQDNGSQTVHKRFTKPDTITCNNNILNNIIINLKEEWKKIKVDLLSHIGFSEIHLLQLQDKNLNTPEIVQSSINHFAYGLKYNEKTKKYREDALSVFMGILRKGQAWIESNYKSSQELALEELVEQRKKEIERYNRRVEELIDLEFSDWHNKLSEQEIEEIVPETFRVTRVPQDIVEYLKKYFRDKILIPRLKEQGISS